MFRIITLRRCVIEIFATRFWRKVLLQICPSSSQLPGLADLVNSRPLDTIARTLHAVAKRNRQIKGSWTGLCTPEILVLVIKGREREGSRLRGLQTPP